MISIVKEENGMIDILDPTNPVNGKPRKRTIRSLKFISHAVKERGEYVLKHFAQMIVIGKRREWKHWIPLDTFIELNPGKDPM